MVKVAMAAMVTWFMVKVAQAVMAVADTAQAVMAAGVTAQAVMAVAVTAQVVMAVAVTVKAVITVKREVLIWAAMVAGDLMAVISLLFLALMVTTAEDSRGLSTLP